MANLLYRLGRFSYRRWPVVILGWLLILGAVGAFGAAKSRPTTDTFTIPGIESLKAADVQKELFPEAVAPDQQVTGQIVIAAPQGKRLSDPAVSAQVDSLMKQLAQGAPQVASAVRRTAFVNPAIAGPALEKQVTAAQLKQGTPTAQARKNAAALSPLSADGRVGIVSWNFDVNSQVDITQSTKDTILGMVRDASHDGLEVRAAGTGLQDTAPPGGTAELIGIAVALVVLFITFGSVVAAGMPILSAVIGVALGLMGVTAATAFFDLASTTSTLASMIGLAVGIDYSLFIISRYRAELRSTTDREHAMGRAIGTAGSAVVFAGLTVVIALSAFTALGIGMLTAMGLAAAGTVAVAVLVALTLVPALMGILKSKAFAGSVRKVAETDQDDHEFVNGAVRFGRLMDRAPAVFAIAGAALLVALALPVSGLHLGLPSDATAAKGTAARQAADLVAEGFGPGRNSQMIAIVDARHAPGTQAQHMADFSTVASWAAGTPGVQNAQVVQANRAGTGAVVLVTPSTGPADRATDDLLEKLRDGQESIEQQTHTSVGITGLTAMATDISAKLNGALLPYLAIVVGLAFLLLVLVFRSIAVPLMATAGFLLSVLAALGVTVKLVQDGMFGIFDPQPIMSFMPTLLIGIVFGLAMDYQVFLTTRMREAYVHGMEPRAAIIDGFRHSGRVVVAAALIMISVFAAFVSSPEPLIKSMGIALATAVLLDAFIVRMVLIPSVMMLLGRRTWWIPRWLDRVLPRVDVEGEGLQKTTH